MAAIAPTADREQTRRDAYDALARRDDALARLVARSGAPDPFFWGVLEEAAGGDAFAELALHIVSQQISTAAALTIFARLRDTLGGTVGPAPIIAASVDDLRAAGLLLHHLRRPDVFPAADVGLLRAAQSVFALARRPTADELAARAERWRPFRSYAAALLWAHGTDRPTTRSET